MQGYALVEFSKYEEAKSAIDALDGSLLYDQPIHCDFAFLKAPIGSGNSTNGTNGNKTGMATRTRSKSPQRR